jgi:hypothetical protein
LGFIAGNFRWFGLLSKSGLSPVLTEPTPEHQNGHDPNAARKSCGKLASETGVNQNGHYSKAQNANESNHRNQINQVWPVVTVLGDVRD